MRLPRPIVGLILRAGLRASKKKFYKFSISIKYTKEPTETAIRSAISGLKDIRKNIFGFVNQSGQYVFCNNHILNDELFVLKVSVDALNTLAVTCCAAEIDRGIGRLKRRLSTKKGHRNASLQAAN